ncbi:hypothetical protein A2U01_0114417, partial [Trifolium medium]|nr:hypothetical protein [Trifolium medium]
PPPTNQSLVRVREWPSERRFGGGREVPARREFWRRFAVTWRCLATAATNLLSSG